MKLYTSTEAQRLTTKGSAPYPDMAALFPKLHVFYRATDHEIISPNKLKRMKLKYFKSGVVQVRLGLVVKRGPGVTLLEAKTMLYLSCTFELSC